MGTCIASGLQKRLSEEYSEGEADGFIGEMTGTQCPFCALSRPGLGSARTLESVFSSSRHIAAC